MTQAERKTDDFTSLAVRLLQALDPGTNYRVLVNKAPDGKMSVEIVSLDARSALADFDRIRLE